MDYIFPSRSSPLHILLAGNIESHFPLHGLCNAPSHTSPPHRYSSCSLQHLNQASVTPPTFRFLLLFPRNSSTAAVSTDSEMEKAASPPSDPNTSINIATSATLKTPRQADFASKFSSLYRSILPPKSLPRRGISFTPPPSSSFDLASDDAIATEHSLNQARLVLVYQQLCDQFDFCFSRLQAISLEREKLRRENADLRCSNSELVKLLNLSSQAAMNRSLRRESGCDFSGKKLEATNSNPVNAERGSLPKSISVRSSGYLKANQHQIPTRQRIASPVSSGSQRVCVTAAKGMSLEEQEALEFEVYNQGMAKTELCNKWQETGTCPYGEQCQFAHGINELRPVIRHPRYKTEVCKMILAGDICHYGHRCHFRHSLTEQERLLLSR